MSLLSSLLFPALFYYSPIIPIIASGHRHVAIFIGNGEIAEANPDVGLRISKITDRAGWQNLVARRYRL
jgi:cell wall-associated NlpC family hydrolase